MRPCTPFFCLFLRASAKSPSEVNTFEVLAFLLALGFLSVGQANVKAIETSFALLRRKFRQRDTRIKNSVTHRFRLIHLMLAALLACLVTSMASIAQAQVSIKFGVVETESPSSFQTLTYTVSSAETLNGVSVPTRGGK